MRIGSAQERHGVSLPVKAFGQVSVSKNSFQGGDEKFFSVRMSHKSFDECTETRQTVILTKLKGNQIMKTYATFALYVASIALAVGTIYAGEWVDVSEQGAQNLENNVYSFYSTSPVIKYKSCIPTAVSDGWNNWGDGGEVKATAKAMVSTGDVLWGTYPLNTPNAIAYLSSSQKMEHQGSPSHLGIQGRYKASGKVRVTYEIICSVTGSSYTTGRATGSGSAFANMAIDGISGEREVSFEDAGCTTSGGYLFGITVKGTGLNGVPVPFTSNSNSYNSGFQSREYLFTMSRTSTEDSYLELPYSISATARADVTATPGWQIPGFASAEISLTAEVSNLDIDVKCPPGE